MKLKSLLLILFLLVTNNLKAQDLNGYKYVIVPERFDFQKSADQYQLNSLVQFLFNKEGFKTLSSNEKIPTDLVNNPCLGLKSNVIENSNMFTTKLTIELTDCRNTTVFTTQEGKSKIKDFKKGHHDALRKAFRDINNLSYAFDPTLVNKPTPVVVEKVVEESPEVAEVVEKVKEEADKKLTEAKEVTENVEGVKKEKLPTKVVKTPESIEHAVITKPLKSSTNTILYAQQIANGFQLVDSTPKIVFMALQSGTKDLYYLKEKAGVLYKEAENWYAEYYEEGKLIKKQLTIKF